MNAATSLLDAVIESFAATSRHQTGVEEPPAAILWADPRAEWKPIIRPLRERLPQVLIFGEYAPDQFQGPAIWLKCVIARTLDEVKLPENVVPIIYMPGVSRQSLRAGEECPRELQPLVELQFRGTVWTQKNGRDWSVEAMLTSDEGLGLDVAKDARTKQSLHASLHVLATTPIAHLTGKRLEAEDFDKLMVGDHPRDLLMWMSDPDTVRNRMTDEGKWHAFKNRCRDDYGFDADTDGELVAGERLGIHEDAAWEGLWSRFCESPALYAGLPDLLDRSKPSTLTFDAEPWPAENDKAEERLRIEMLGMAELDEAAARQKIGDLEKQHGVRRAWVWAKLGKCPLAFALSHLAKLADATERHLGGDTPDDMAKLYVDGAFLADDAAMKAPAAVKANNDEQAVTAAVRALYLNWANDAACRLQQVTQMNPLPSAGEQPGIEAGAGCVILFADGLRFDLGQRLRANLEERGLRVTMSRRWAALPSVTATAKPAVSPVVERVKGVGLPETFAPENTDGQPLTTPRFRKLIEDAGYQVIDAGETGNAGEPDARGWTEFGRIDRHGHELKARLVGQLADELDRLTERVVELIEAGWTSVRIVTDHGWLLMPGGLPRHDLPKYLTESKWSRCATIKGESKVTVPKAGWHWNRAAEFASAPGISCFSAGQEYAHGGISLQECVIPDLTVEPVGGAGGPKASIVDVQWLGLRCRVTVDPPDTTLQVDVRTKPNAADSSIVATLKPVGDDGKAGVVVEDEDLQGTAAVVVLIDASGRLVAKHQTTVGGDD
ncbi:MAG: BREX-1 system phosphatase PglZ type B [Phycisphaerae bacterium]|nr:BREX-1 system phosphatase PglZ type B [Phycisphaerae bacterium]